MMPTLAFWSQIMNLSRTFSFVLFLSSIGCDIQIGKTTDDDDDDDAGFAEDDSTSWGGGSSTGDGTDGSGSGGTGSGGGSSEGGDSDDGPDGNLGGIGGDGEFDVDTLFVMWEGVYRDGSAVAGTYRNDDGDYELYPNTFSFIWIDSVDYSQDSEDYICRLVYDSTSASVADFSDFETADTAYMTFLMDLGAGAPETTGNCGGAAFAFGVEDITDVVEDTPWGFGYGPMTDDFEAELDDNLDDYSSLGSRPGVTYLRWQNQSGDEFTAWGYFQVVPFVSAASNELELPVEDPSDFLSGVRDNPEPSDGLYYQETLYILQYNR